MLADDGVAFDGASPRERPLGGAESAFVALAEALAAAGATVCARTRGARPMELNGVTWRDIADDRTADVDLYIANRSAGLLTAPVTAGVTAFWLHNPAQFLGKPRYLLPLLQRRPFLVFLGPHHAGTASWWIPSAGRVIIGHGVEAPFLETPRAPGVPPPRAVFTSNPSRGLDRLLRLWRAGVAPLAPGAELHVFSGPETYSSAGAKAEAMRAVLAEAAATPGIVLRGAQPKAALARALGEARVLVYLGDPGETFCLAVAEAQAMGVPAVVKPVGAVGERVAHGATGFVEVEDAAFVARTAALLSDDALWAQQSAAAMAQRGELRWAKAAEAFLSLVKDRRRA